MKIVSVIQFFKHAWPAFFLSNAQAAELPKELLSGIVSSEFSEREAAERKLLTWSRERLFLALPELVKISDDSGDPELSARCFSVFRELVFEQYMKEGEGYLGIQMLNQKVILPRGTEAVSVIEVQMLVAGAPAEQAGLLAGDLIVALDGVANQTTDSFMAIIRKTTPNTNVLVQVMRGKELRDVHIRLTRRPAGLDNNRHNVPGAGVDAYERSSREAFLRNWLKKYRALQE